MTGWGSNDKKIKLFDLKKLNLISEKKQTVKLLIMNLLIIKKFLISFEYNENMMELY